MRLFGFEIDVKAAPRHNGTELPFSTEYSNGNFGNLDGTKIAYDNRTYVKMYRRNTDVRRCVEEKQQTAMKDGYEIRKVNRTDGKEKAVKYEPFEEALKRSGGAAFLKDEIVKNLEIFGNAFVRIRRSSLGTAPHSFEALDARYVSVATDSDLVPVRYMYRNPVKRGAVEEIMAADVVHAKGSTDPDNPVFGMTVLETLVVDVLGDEEAAMANYAFFTNDGIPSALYVFKENLTQQAKDDAIKQIRDMLQGGHNKHKSLASTAVNDVKLIGNGHTDADHVTYRKTTTEKVCAAMGVPRIILGYVEDVNYSNGETQYEKFIENTVRPLERKLEEVFTRLLAEFDGNLVFRVNDEHIDDFEKRSRLARENVLGGIMTVNEAREYVGYEAVADEFADSVLVPTTARLLEDLGAGTDPVVLQTAPVPAPQGEGKALAYSEKGYRE